MHKILVDTDIGSDIDDAVCLAYLLERTDAELLGITTVTGQPERRAKIASVLCRAVGRDIPIYAGTASPLLIPQYQTEAPQADVAERYSHTDRFESGGAVPFLRETIRRHPGEVSLLTIGPLTNIGLLFALDPEIPSMLEQVVTMGGVFGPPPPNYGETEWNLSGDPHASAIVFRRSVRHRVVGLDVTHRLWMDAATLRRRFVRPLFDLAREIGQESLERWGGMVFHDPLAAATIFAPELCRYERGTVSIDTVGPTVGASRFAPDENGPHSVAVTVDPEAFFDRFFR
ncbi:MAG: nucleoside hydrolase [Capsulimonadales bacterium]|nr:nucleoside hydrolase [Capsulimonadales bacterium]